MNDASHMLWAFAGVVVGFVAAVAISAFVRHRMDEVEGRTQVYNPDDNYEYRIETVSYVPINHEDGPPKPVEVEIAIKKPTLH